MFIKSNNWMAYLFVSAALLLFSASCGGGGVSTVPDALDAGDDAAVVDDGSGGAGADAAPADSEGDEGPVAEVIEDYDGGEGADEDAEEPEAEAVILAGLPDAELIYASYDTFMDTLQVEGEAGSAQPGATVYINLSPEVALAVIANADGSFSLPPTEVDLIYSVGVSQQYGELARSKSVSVTVWFF
ncbi:hypothetical protein JW859_14370 [bacterium]|nr:hypothetical protein [bacterium]